MNTLGGNQNTVQNAEYRYQRKKRQMQRKTNNITESDWVKDRTSWNLLTTDSLLPHSEAGASSGGRSPTLLVVSWQAWPEPCSAQRDLTAMTTCIPTAWSQLICLTWTNASALESNSGRAFSIFINKNNSNHDLISCHSTQRTCQRASTLQSSFLSLSHMLRHLLNWFIYYAKLLL